MEKKAHIKIAVIFTILLLLTGFLLVSSYSPKEAEAVKGSVYQLDGGWCLEGQERVSLPLFVRCSQTGERHGVENKLDPAYSGQYLEFTVKNGSVHIYIDGKLYYEDGYVYKNVLQKTITNIAGNGKNIVKLPEFTHPVGLRIELEAVDADDTIKLENITIYGTDAIVVTLFRNSIGLFGCCILIFVCIVLLLLIDAISRIFRMGAKNLFHLALFGIFALIHSTSQMDVLQMVFGNDDFFTVASLLGLILMPNVLAMFYFISLPEHCRNSMRRLITLNLYVSLGEIGVFCMLRGELLGVLWRVAYSMQVVTNIVILFKLASESVRGRQALRKRLGWIAQIFLLLSFGRSVFLRLIEVNDSRAQVVELLGLTAYMLLITLHVILDAIATYDSNMKNARQEALAASEAKSAFLSNMSHEIRTPINAVLGMDEMVLRECEDETILGYAENIKNAGNSLLGIVNDILDFSKIEAGKMDIIPVEYDFASVLNDLVTMISIRAKNKGLKLQLKVDPEMPNRLFGDEIRLKQVVTNILTNAVKYTEKGSVSLQVGFERMTGSMDGQKEVYLLINVKDTGIGIKKEDLSKLFSAFERIEEKRNRTIEGTGLGMNITSMLLEMMGSRLEVESVYGEGSDFHFRLKQGVVDWKPIGNYEETYRQSIAKHEKYHEKFTAPDARILVVDDTEMNLKVVKGLLKQTRIQVDTAQSGFECLDKIRSGEDYHVIFLDHRMPEMDGLETLAKLKEIAGFSEKGIPVIALTANAVSGAREEYIQAGFDDYLTKPVNGDLLEKLLAEVLPQEFLQESTDTENVDLADGEHRDFVDEPDVEIKSDETRESSRIKVEGLDEEEGIAYCGSYELYLQLLEDFYKLIELKSTKVENYLAEGNIREYTVEVHGLKSTARMIGAKELGEEFYSLEQMGDRNDIDQMKQKTPLVLDHYRNYRHLLEPFFGKTKIQKKKATTQDFIRVLEQLRNAVDEFDLDGADAAMEELESYEIPQAFIPDVEHLSALVTNVEMEEVMELAEGLAKKLSVMEQ